MKIGRIKTMAIKLALVLGVSPSKIARKFNIARSSVYRIKGK
tara:strand:+ start:3971 stop:4096 length:126 start_codon:yes stop_codon:yes gene_type:complete